MSLAAEHFRALKQNVDFNQLDTTEKVQSELRKVIADTQQLTLSQMDDSLTRQLGSILFSHEAGMIAALSAINPAEVQWSKTKKLSLSTLFSLFGAIASACSISMTWNAGKYLWAILSIAGAALFITGALWPKEKPTAKIRQGVNAEALFLLAERRMEAIDRDLEAFLTIPTGSADEDEGVLQLITKAVSMKKEDQDSIPDELMTVITALSISRGYSLIEYNGMNDGYFDIMPTIRETRTIVPALFKNDRLLQRGMAILKTQETTEAMEE